jgi:Rrf2 family protein
MNFSKTASYSLNILSYMAEYEEIKMSASFLNKELSIPYPYLRQILSNLSKSGFIHSKRGRNGGFVFSRSTEKIFLSEIIESTDGLNNLNKCILGFRECPFDNRCAMHTVWEDTRNNIMNILKQTSLKDFPVKRS